MNLNKEDLQEIIKLLTPIYDALGDNSPYLDLIEEKLMDSYMQGYTKALQRRGTNE